jgi:HSP20 family protein
MLSAASAGHRKFPNADSEYSQRANTQAIARAQSMLLPLRETGCAARAPRVPSIHTRDRSKTMNELRVSDPFAVEPMDEMFRQMLRPWRSELAERAPQIKLDVHENDASYTVKAEVPGVSKEDIDVRIEGNLVTLSAEVKKDKEEKKDGRVLRSERHYGYASRSFTLACEVDEAKAEARYKDGILELTLPKKTKTSSKRLPIA